MAQTHQRFQQRSLIIALITGVIVLTLKYAAWRLTGSAAIFSDTAESMVHVAVGAFALFSLRVSSIPPDEDHHYGHDKIGYISMGLEGVLILMAAVVVLVECVNRSIHPLPLERMGEGTLLIGATVVINGLLGLYLLRVGRTTSSLIVKSTGKFILADVWTSFGVVLGLQLSSVLGWPFLDPIIGLGFAVFLVKPGIGLIRHSILGLMDATNKEHELRVYQYLTQFCAENGMRFHGLRLRESGATVHVDFHLQFPDDTTLPVAHTLTTRAEHGIESLLDGHIIVMTHIEPFTIPESEQDRFDPHAG